MSQDNNHNHFSSFIYLSFLANFIIFSFVFLIAIVYYILI